MVIASTSLLLTACAVVQVNDQSSSSGADRGASVVKVVLVRGGRSSNKGVSEQSAVTDTVAVMGGLLTYFGVM